jgi:hypothetical protein
MLRNFIQARPKLAQGSAQERGFLLFFFHDGLSFSSSVHPSLAHPMSFQSAYSLSFFFFFFVCVLQGKDTIKLYHYTLETLNFNTLIYLHFFFQVTHESFCSSKARIAERDRKK